MAGEMMKFHFISVHDQQTGFTGQLRIDDPSWKKIRQYAERALIAELLFGWLRFDEFRLDEIEAYFGAARMLVGLDSLKLGRKR